MHINALKFEQVFLSIVGLVRLSRMISKASGGFIRYSIFHTYNESNEVRNTKMQKKSEVGICACYKIIGQC